VASNDSVVTDMAKIDISYRRICQIAGPVVVTNFSYTMMGAIDTIMVGHLGVSALAAVGLGNMISFSLLSFFWGLTSGIDALTAQAFGARDRDGVGRVFFQGLYLALMCGVVILAAMPLVRMLLGWVDASPEVERVALEFMNVRLYGGITVVVLWACDNFYRGLGRTTIMMWCGMAQLVLNCSFNWVLIHGRLGFPAIGAAGAALGTVLAQLAIALFLLGSILWFGRVRHEFSMRRHWRFQPELFRRMVRLSVPIGVQTGLEMGGVTVFLAVVARLGDAELAATNAVIQAWSVAFMGALALAVGSTTLVGQCVGAREPEQARVVVRRVSRLGYGLMAVFGVVYLLAPRQLMALFVTAEDLPRLVEFARPLFTVVVVCLLFDLKFNLLSGALRGAGDTAYSMWVNVTSAWLLFVPALFFATPRWGLVGAWSCFVLHLVAMSTLLELRVRGSRWLHEPVLQRLPPPEVASDRLAAERVVLPP
jgi:MATE family multidrug resistance protein